MDALSPDVKSFPLIFCHDLPVPLHFRGGATLRVVSLTWPRGAGGGEVLGGAPGAAGEGDAGGQADGVSPAGEPSDHEGHRLQKSPWSKYLSKLSVLDTVLLITLNRRNKRTRHVCFLLKSAVSLALLGSSDGPLLFHSTGV